MEENSLVSSSLVLTEDMVPSSDGLQLKGSQPITNVHQRSKLSPQLDTETWEGSAGHRTMAELSNPLSCKTINNQFQKGGGGGGRGRGGR